jgi:uncharacterized membrane protein
MNSITLLWNVLPLSSNWMTWNLFLALVPLALSVCLFRGNPPRSVIWWIGVLVFMAFLPNAPYVITDIKHLVTEIQMNSSMLFNTLVVIPKYIIFLFVGFGAYVWSVLLLENYLQRQKFSPMRVLQIELAVHGLCVIGVYLGRFERFNSWDLVTRPHQVIIRMAETLLHTRPLIFMGFGFVLIVGLYWMMKEIILALSLKYQYQNQETLDRSPH